MKKLKSCGVKVELAVTPKIFIIFANTANSSSPFGLCGRELNS